ncbi:MAG: beta-ketoacyl-ACP synthase [Beijerinckiaceae bacterium]
MTDLNRRTVWMTGAGIVSSLGEGLQAHWDGAATAPVLDSDTFAPVTIHPLPSVDFDKQIAKKSDQRQMELWQRIGTYAAGLALDDAGVKGKPELLEILNMIVAAGGGERDLAVDGAVTTGLMAEAEAGKGRYLNERLMSDLRPTLFLAQLSNLLAGNISIVHGVTGPSRTFMGEEQAGVDAVRVAHARIAAGQGDLFLVGGAMASGRPDLHFLYELGGYMRRGPWAPVLDRKDASAGFDLGAMGAFAVLEAEDHARARGAKPLAMVSVVVADRSRRQPGDAATTVRNLWDAVAPRLKKGRYAILSGASGARSVTREEREALAALAPAAPVRAIGNLIGHGVEAHFPAALILAGMVVQHDKLFPPAVGAKSEFPFDGPVDQVVITGLGHWRGEGLALIERVG